MLIFLLIFLKTLETLKTQENIEYYGDGKLRFCENEVKYSFVCLLLNCHLKFIPGGHGLALMF